MKIAVTLLLIILAVLACGCTAQAPAATSAASPTVPAYTTAPDLTGRWTGMTFGHTQKEGFREPAFIQNITMQKGWAFAGVKEYIRADGKTYYENFSGVISPGGELFIADSVGGISDGRLTGPDTMELLYAEEGPDAKAYYMPLTRQKS